VLNSKPNPLIVDSADDMKELLRHVFYKLPWIPTGVLTYFVSEKVARIDIDRQIVQDLEAGEVGSGLTQVLKDIHAPTMLTWGDKDELIDISCGQ
jgi:pimeloyl-ACP methyl ester carboxylesterase